MEAVSFSGSPAVRLLLTCVIAVLLFLQGWHRLARLFVVAVGGGSLLNTLVKKVVERRRPRSLLGVTQAGGSSFPSGHSNGALVFSGAVTIVVWQLTRSRVATAIAGTAGVAATALIGYSRVALRQHHTADVLAGYAIGAAWLAVLLRRYTRANSN
jgi:membrane-associated phospholipid phosphatase